MYEKLVIQIEHNGRVYTFYRDQFISLLLQNQLDDDLAYFPDSTDSVRISGYALPLLQNPMIGYYRLIRYQDGPSVPHFFIPGTMYPQYTTPNGQLAYEPYDTDTFLDAIAMPHLHIRFYHMFRRNLFEERRVTPAEILAHLLWVRPFFVGMDAIPMNDDAYVTPASTPHQRRYFYHEAITLPWNAAFELQQGTVPYVPTDDAMVKIVRNYPKWTLGVLDYWIGVMKGMMVQKKSIEMEEEKKDYEPDYNPDEPNGEYTPPLCAIQ
jgi:hypothetical protein